VLDGDALRDVVRRRYRWDDVAVAYEALAMELVAGSSTRARKRRRAGEHAPGATDAASHTGIEGSLR